MFFIAGAYPKREQLDFYEPIMCGCCGRYGRYEAFVEYNVFSLFFIPLLRFSKKFYARATCCGSLFLIKNKEKGLMMERGQGHNVSLKDEDLVLIQKGISFNVERCPYCGYEVEGDYKYCPNCGNELNR